MDIYHEAIKKKEKDNILKEAEKTAETSGIWGGLSGALHGMLYGNRTIGGVLGRGIGTGLTSALVGGGASLLGNALIGPPKEGDPSAYTRQGALGGALGGGLLGGGSGYLLGSGKLSWLSDLPGAEMAGKMAKTALPLDNIITDYVKSQLEHPTSLSGLKTAALLGLVGAGLGSLEGTEAGMDQDTRRNLEEVQKHA